MHQLKRPETWGTRKRLSIHRLHRRMLPRAKEAALQLSTACGQQEAFREALNQGRGHVITEHDETWRQQGEGSQCMPSSEIG